MLNDLSYTHQGMTFSLSATLMSDESFAKSIRFFHHGAYPNAAGCDAKRNVLR